MLQSTIFSVILADQRVGILQIMTNLFNATVQAHDLRKSRNKVDLWITQRPAKILFVGHAFHAEDDLTDLESCHWETPRNSRSASPARGPRSIPTGQISRPVLPFRQQVSAMDPRFSDKCRSVVGIDFGPHTRTAESTLPSILHPLLKDGRYRRTLEILIDIL